MSSTDIESDIHPQRFWASFQQEAEELRAKVFRRELLAAHQRIEQLLAAANYPHVHELTTNGTDGVLILTPEGDRSVASVVDWFVGFAPRIPGWVVHRRRQARPPDQAIGLTEKAFDVSLSDALFMDVECSDGMAVMVFSSASERLRCEQHQGLVAFLLQHLLGEETVMQFVAGGMLEPLPRDKEGLMSPASFVSFLHHQFNRG
jgi:hypothetical protein